MATIPEYHGFYEEANEPETNKWIEVFVSDWNKDYFGFYAYIDLATYERDIDNIWKFISSFNYGGDIYIELIDHSLDKEMREFYEWLYKKGYYTDWAALDKEQWDKYWKNRR